MVSHAGARPRPLRGRGDREHAIAGRADHRPVGVPGAPRLRQRPDRRFGRRGARRRPPRGVLRWPARLNRADHPAPGAHLARGHGRGRGSAQRRHAADPPRAHGRCARGYGQVDARSFRRADRGRRHVGARHGRHAPPDRRDGRRDPRGRSPRPGRRASRAFPGVRGRRRRGSPPRASSSAKKAQPSAACTFGATPAMARSRWDVRAPSSGSPR